jgi:release factor glutamine methyltransferase
MNEKSKPKTPSIETWLRNASAKLNGLGIESARLDAEIILAHTLRHPRTYLHAHSDDVLDSRMLEIADARLNLRIDRVPVAYIIGHKEFYGRRFKVSTATLIPRPETEVMIDLLRDIVPSNLPLLPQTLRLVDVGTGSGVIGITAKLEFPELDVTLCDVSIHALNVAEKNARSLGANVQFLRSDLLGGYPFQPDIILANLPYVDVQWDISPELTHEPSEALYAGKEGLALIDKLIEQAKSRLATHGYLLLEADLRQHASIIQTAKETGFTMTATKDMIICLQKD